MSGEKMQASQLTVKDMFRAIANYQWLVHGIDYVPLTMKQRMQLTRDYVLAMNVEQVELLQELPWKPWKYAESLTENLVKLKTPKVIAEWVDCLFFLVDEALVLEITAEEVTETFKAVLDKNYARKTGD
jgi:hypothetical protein